MGRAPTARGRARRAAWLFALAGVVAGIWPAAAVADVFSVRSTANGGPDSLRRAILDANATAGTDTVRFEIPGPGVRTINLTSQLPDITDPVTVNAYTQPGASPNTLATGNNAVLRVQLNGAGLFSPGSRAGLTVNTDDSTIRGLVINRFEENGVDLEPGADRNTIAGNFIGTAPGGTAARPNGGGFSSGTAGVNVDRGSDNRIGGTGPGARNLISGNAHEGIQIQSASGEATGNIILGNYVGTDRHGAAAVPNGHVGVKLSLGGVGSNVVGGTESGARNIISGNGREGVHLCCTGGSDNRVEGNFIGTDAAGTGALGNNGQAGVLVSSSHDNSIGGTVRGAGNRIAHNEGPGVGVPSAFAVGNEILRNFIFSNGGLGIDLGSPGVTANDADDVDTGGFGGSANRLQNFPVISSATRSQATQLTTIAGTLDSNPNQTFRIECFVAAPDPSGHGEGRIPAGQTTATTDAGGDDSFACVTPVPQAGQVVTATATNTATGDTSEFSQVRGVTAVP